jgi:type VI secretion system protein VasG
LGRIQARVKENHNIPFTYEDTVVDLVAGRCNDPASGARMVDAILTHTLLPEISKEYLNRLMGGTAIARVHVGVESGDFKYVFE